MPAMRTLPKAAVSIGLALTVLGLAACASDPKSPAHTARNVDLLYPLKAAPTPDQIALALHPEGLSQAQSLALRDLAQRRSAADGGTITVSVPRGGPDSVLAEQGLRAVRDRLVAEGVAVQDIDSKLYDTTDPKAPLLVVYTAVKADVPVCGKKWDDLTHTRDNAVYSTFGCSLTANMAAQIANPNDIVHPQTETAANIDRRITVLHKYEAGIDTSSQQDAAKSGIISHAIN